METKTLTIMFVDLVDYTKKTSQTTRQKFIEHLENYKSIAEPIFPKYKGHIIKEIGEAFMVSFESPTNAVLCGIDLQNSILEHNKKAEKNNRLHIKVAINTGEVHIKKGDLYGDAVNIASRLESITKVDRIYFTESVFLAMNKNEVTIGFVGNKKGKGLKHPIRVYTVLGKYENVLRNIKVKKNKAMKKVRKVIAAVIALIFLMIVVGLIGFILIYSDVLF